MVNNLVRIVQLHDVLDYSLFGGVEIFLFYFETVQFEGARADSLEFATFDGSSSTSTNEFSFLYKGFIIAIIDAWLGFDATGGAFFARKTFAAGGFSSSIGSLGAFDFFPSDYFSFFGLAFSRRHTGRPGGRAAAESAGRWHVPLAHAR